jgi:hypothetical protein
MAFCLHNNDMSVRTTVHWLFLVFPFLLGGCATSTVESRKQERYNAFTELTPEQQGAVEKGQIKAGMNMDGVYIAWGKPSQILDGESSQGATVTWLYQDTVYEPHPFWTYQTYCYGPRGYYGAPYYGYSYHAQSYIRAEVIFHDGLVHEWRRRTGPPY